MSAQNERLKREKYEAWNPHYEAVSWTEFDVETGGTLNINKLHSLHIDSHFEAVSAILNMMEYRL